MLMLGIDMSGWGFGMVGGEGRKNVLIVDGGQICDEILVDRLADLLIQNKVIQIANTAEPAYNRL